MVKKEVNEMNMEEVRTRLKEIVVDRLDCEEGQITPEASFVEDLGADSSISSN
jgi:acyl carrier protein